MGRRNTFNGRNEKIYRGGGLAFLTIDGMYRAMGYEEGRNNDLPQFTDHCFTGDYPTALTDREGDEDFRQLSLLQEQG